MQCCYISGSRFLLLDYPTRCCDRSSRRTLTVCSHRNRLSLRPVCWPPDQIGPHHMSRGIWDPYKGGTRLYIWSADHRACVLAWSGTCIVSFFDVPSISRIVGLYSGRAAGFSQWGLHDAAPTTVLKPSCRIHVLNGLTSNVDSTWNAKLPKITSHYSIK